MKLETYLRMAKISYKTAPVNIMKAPKGRIPYVEMDGRLMGDSNLIIQSLKGRFGDPFDGGLTREQRAHALSIQSLTEDHLYFASAWLRWTDEESWKYVREVFRPMMPPLLGGMILKRIRKDFLKDLRSHGIGRHTREEVIEFAKSDLTALSDILGDKPYFLGDQATLIDATMYGFLIQHIWIPWDSELKRHTTSLKNILTYCERMKQQYWS